MEALENLSGMEVTIKTGMDEKELTETIPSYHAAVVRSATKITKNAIQAAGNLELIVRAGIGLDNIDVAEAEAKGIKVANTPSATTISVAEHTFGLMLGVVRSHGQANISMKEHKWEKKKFKGTELYGKTLGIIGSGRIGLAVADRAIAFGMTVLVYDIIEVQTKLNLRQVDLDELLAEADVISLHLPLTDMTSHMISRDEFDKMKDGVVIINAARGGVLDEKALLSALESGKVSGVGIDVYEKEPTDNFPLIDRLDVVATPHIGAAAKEGQRRAGFEVLNILKKTFLS